MSTGISFPFRDDPKGVSAFAMDETTRQSVRSNLFTLYTTDEGERWYSDFGMRLREMLFNQNTPADHEEIEAHIRQKTNRWIPNVQLVSIQATITERNSVLFQLGYTYTDVVYQFSDVISFELAS